MLNFEFDNIIGDQGVFNKNDLKESALEISDDLEYFGENENLQEETYGYYFLLLHFYQKS